MLHAFVSQLKSQNFLEMRDDNENTLLIGAAFTGNVGAVKMLLCGGASASSTTLVGETPLHRVLSSAAWGPWEMDYDWPTNWVGRWEVVKTNTILSIMEILLNAGADPNAENKNGIRSFHYVVLAALRLDSIACVEHLCRCGAGPRIGLDGGLSVLQLALEPRAFLRLMSTAAPLEEEGEMQRLKTARGLVRMCIDAGIPFNRPEHRLDEPVAYALALCECNPVGLKAMLEEGIESSTALRAGQTAFRCASLWMKDIHGIVEKERENLISLSKKLWVQWQQDSHDLSAEFWATRRKIQGRTNLEIIKKYLDKEDLAVKGRGLEVLLEEEMSRS